SKATGCITSGSPAKSVASKPGGRVIFFNDCSGERGLSLGFWVLTMPGGSVGGSGVARRATAAKPINKTSAILFVIMAVKFLFLAREQRAAIDILWYSAAPPQAHFPEPRTLQMLRVRSA